MTNSDEACVAGMPLTEARLNGMKKVAVFYELLEHYMGLVRIKKGMLGGKLFQLLINSVSKNLVVVHHTVLLPPRLIKKIIKCPILMILSPAPQVSTVDQHH